jgi:hypothetical protein
MQLEKATSANSEAGLAGWISSNDVTLFTMVLVVVVAMFLHGKLATGKGEIKDLGKKNETLNEDLGLATSERNELIDALGKSNQELEKSNQKLAERNRDLEVTLGDLQVTKDKKVVVEKELIDALEEINDLSIKMVTAQQIRLSLQKAKTNLEQRGTDLDSQVRTLTTNKKDLEDEKKSLSERMTALATQLKDRLKVFEDLEKERDRLKQQADKLDAIVTTLEMKLTDSGTKITTLATKAGESEAEYQKRIVNLEKVAGDQTKRADDYLARLRRAANLFQGLRKSNANLTEKLDGAEKRYQLQLTRETMVNRKLVGINGKLKRVAMLFDASGSMKRRDDDGAVGDRWKNAQDIASTWLGHLDVDECVLIVFSSDVRTFPTDGTMSKIHGPDGEANRAALMAQLKSVEPEGWTNTLEALEKAYSYRGIDTILLFSDGAPTFANSGRFDPDVAKQIYALCRKHSDVPINTVGLGNYFDKNLSTFLRTVANISGGTFRGR